MPFDLTYDPDRDWIILRISGILDAPGVLKIAADLSRMVSACGCKCILTDARGADLGLSTVELYDLPKLAAETLPPTIKRAHVVSSDLSDHSFLETVSVNWGQNVKVFRELDDARRWLLTDEGPA